MQRKVEKSRMVEFQTTGNRQVPDIINGVYLGLLSRFPTAEEQETMQAYFKKFGTSRRQPTRSDSPLKTRRPTVHNAASTPTL